MSKIYLAGGMNEGCEGGDGVSDDELESLKRLICQSFGYDTMFYWNGGWTMQRTGAGKDSGYIHQAGLAEALRYSPTRAAERELTEEAQRLGLYGDGE